MKLAPLSSLVLLAIALASSPDFGLAEEGRSTVAATTGHVGFRRTKFQLPDNPRDRKLLLWYPTEKPDERYDYRGQVGRAAVDAEVAPGKHPLIIFSHGYLGVADQSIFITEAFARHGYIVAATNHADSLAEPAAGRSQRPRFVDPKSWDDKKYRDRKDDVSGLIDYLLAENDREGSNLFGRIDPQAIGGAGHSLGGYTVLGLCGGWPSWRDERMKAGLLLAPFAAPYLDDGDLAGVRTPIMIQGGTLDFAIQPALPPVYKRLGGPKYHLDLKAENHFGWTNFAAVGKTTTEVVQQGNPQLIVDYAIAFFDQHLLGVESKLLTEDNPRLDRFKRSE